MPPTYKEQTQLLIPPRIKSRIEALAVVRDESMANVSRVALEAGLIQFTEAEDESLARLRKALDAMGLDYETGVHAMVSSRPRIRMADLFDAHGQPRGQFPGVIG